MNDSPSVAVIIPSYNSFQTIERSLVTFSRQNYPTYEIIVLDSSPDNRVKEIVTTRFPDITYIHSEKQLLPHAARNLGTQNTSCELLVFTDPDIYAPPDWIQNLVGAHQQSGSVIIGSLTNHTNSWLDWGIHLGKFDSFLPGLDMHPIDFCATANMLCSRSDFELTGGFDANEMLGDLVISWKFIENHVAILFVPQAIVEHHHIQTFGSFLRERYLRGMDFGRLRIKHFRWKKLQTLRHLLITVSGLRLISLIWREGKHSLKAKLFAKFLYTLPISFAGQVLWLSGETIAFLRALAH